jgi:hypothetical protein
MADRISPTAPIIANPERETALVKLQRQERLNNAELAAVARFRLAENTAAVETTATAQDTFVASAFRRRRTARRSNYMDVDMSLRRRTSVSVSSLVRSSYLATCGSVWGHRH